MAERRQLTVMFCDLVESTALSRKLDPEDLHEIMRRYQECTAKVVTDWRGFVARYVGDGMLAYFGYPTAEEDDAARAIHAALGVIEAVKRLSAQLEGLLDRPLGVRTGIATGLVVVGDLIGEGASEQTIAMGETPNLAARLQALANENCIVVATRTRELASGLFECADAGAHELKGYPQPVQAWYVTGTSDVESRFDAAHGGRVTPLIGRAEEIDTLLERWQLAKRGRGQIVLLSGDAGIGKSRIAETLCERISGERHIRICYQCSPYHGSSALHPFIHHLEKAAHFTRTDSVEQKLDKLDAYVAKGPSRNSGETAALLAALLSLPTSTRYPVLHMTPQQQKERTLAALVDRLEALAAKGPVLVLLEDAHWIDPTSSEAVALFVRRAERVAALAIVTSRSAPDYSWATLPHVLSIPLDRLDSRESAAMVDRLLEGRQYPPALAQQIVARADGVPLFIEELANTVTAADGALDAVLHSSIPSTLQDSLMARLDRLGQAKEVAQISAVIGREFSRELLAAIVPFDQPELDVALSTLTASTVVFGSGPPPPSTFVFKHALLQDAAYSSLLRARRQALHGRLAATLEQRYPERVRVEPEVLAHHYTQAGQWLPAARYWAAAAQRALERFGNLEALVHASKGLEVVSSHAEGGERDRLELGLEILRGAAYRAVGGFACSDAERSFTRALALAERLGDVARTLDARRGLFACFYARGALALAREQARHVATLGVTLKDSGAQMLGHWMLGCVMFWRGEFASARADFERAFALYDADRERANALGMQIDPGVNAILHLSWTLWILGYADQAQRASEKAVEGARALSQPFTLAMALFWACTTRACCGDHDTLGKLLDELSAVTAQHGLGYLGSCARVVEAQRLVSQNEGVAALEQLGRAFAEFQAQEAGLGLPWAISISATAYARLGKAQEGLAALAKAFGAAARTGERHWEAELWRLKGELLLLQPDGDSTEAERCFCDAIALARRQGAKALELRATLSLARLLSGRGEIDAARRTLREAYDTFSEGFDTADMREAKQALERMR